MAGGTGVPRRPRCSSAASSPRPSARTARARSRHRDRPLQERRWRRVAAHLARQGGAPRPRHHRAAARARVRRRRQRLLADRRLGESWTADADGLPDGPVSTLLVAGAPADAFGASPAAALWSGREDAPWAPSDAGLPDGRIDAVAADAASRAAVGRRGRPGVPQRRRRTRAGRRRHAPSRAEHRGARDRLLAQLARSCSPPHRGLYRSADGGQHMGAPGGHASGPPGGVAARPRSR